MADHIVLRRPTRLPLTHKQSGVPEATHAAWKILAELRPFPRDLVLARLRELSREAREAEEARHG